MFLYKLLALAVLGAGVGSILMFYLVEKHQDYKSIEWATLAILLLSIKNYVLRILGIWNTMISVNFGDSLPWLCFGLGYTLTLVFLSKGLVKDKLKTEGEDEAIQTIAKEKEFTSTIFLVCFGTNLCLLAIASFSYLHIINNL